MVYHRYFVELCGWIYPNAFLQSCFHNSFPETRAIIVDKIAVECVWWVCVLVLLKHKMKVCAHVCASQTQNEAKWETFN